MLSAVKVVECQPLDHQGIPMECNILNIIIFAVEEMFVFMSGNFINILIIFQSFSFIFLSLPSMV